ncbi:Uncharacterised protein [Legionella wadsworthii]|uniref:Uncharacterized protein n=2 Tax=Legionella wadsworthii TaxID=28088 RepID=A0A378LVW2_9GAMM|nr:Uncharacterised protein [Legionella wadsworthii]
MDLKSITLLNHKAVFETLDSSLDGLSQLEVKKDKADMVLTRLLKVHIVFL